MTPRVGPDRRARRALLFSFIKGSRKPAAQVEPTIARLARAVYDEWNAPAPPTGPTTR